MSDQRSPLVSDPSPTSGIPQVGSVRGPPLPLIVQTLRAGQGALEELERVCAGAAEQVVDYSQPTPRSEA
jgi:hypothetical protein